MKIEKYKSIQVYLKLLKKKIKLEQLDCISADVILNCYKEPYMMCGFIYLFILKTGPLKKALSVEAKAWKMVLCHYLNEEYKKKMTDMMSFITTYLKKLSRPLRDLDDVRLAMEALSIIRDNKIQMDMTLGPIEVR